MERNRLGEHACNYPCHPLRREAVGRTVTTFDRPLWLTYRRRSDRYLSRSARRRQNSVRLTAIAERRADRRK